MIVRTATPEDAQNMSEILNEIIAIGGTTAFLKPVSANTGGRASYRSRGFLTWKEDKNATLSDGRNISKVPKRYEL